MNPLTLDVNIAPEQRTRAILRVLNGLLGLTERELDVLQAFLAISTRKACSPVARKAAARELGMSVPVLNIYVKTIRDKGVIQPDPDGGYRYHPMLTLEGVDSILIRFTHAAQQTES